MGIDSHERLTEDSQPEVSGRVKTGKKEGCELSVAYLYF